MPASLQALRDELIALSNINSGSYNAAGVDAVAAHMAERLGALGAEVELIELEPLSQLQRDGSRRTHRVGRLLRARRARGAARSVFLGGHLDTVFAEDDPFQTATERADGTLHGPGVADLKGGLLVMCEALQMFQSGAHGDALDWEVILNPEEEIGSPQSAPHLAEAAARHDVGLVFEPALPGGVLAAGRKGSGNFIVQAHGRSAHAGRDHAMGRNAIRALAEFTVALDDLNGQREGVTINPATMSGGGTINRVPDYAQLHFNVRVQTPDQAQWFESQLAEIESTFGDVDGICLELEGGFHRPPKPRSAGLERLYGWLSECAEELDQALSWQDTGGCCDGNNLAAAGLVNIDTLGVIGGDIHSDAEWMEIASLHDRARLSARLLEGMARGEFDLAELRDGA